METLVNIKNTAGCAAGCTAGCAVPAAPAVSRRGFFAAAIYGMVGVIASILSGTAAAYLLVPPKARKSEQWIEIGDVTKLVPDQPVEIVFHRNRTDGWKTVSEKMTAWVVKTADSVVALCPQCTHLGCATHWEEGKDRFVCPCHNSLFSIDGKNVSGPAPRPLDRYDLKVQGSKLLLGGLRRSADTSV